MLKFNEDYEKLPNVYTDTKELGYERTYSLMNGWHGFTNNKTLPKFKIGQKYYMIKDNNCIAFKVVSIAFIDMHAYYELLFADGKTKTIFQDSIEYYDIFKNIKDYQAYKETKDESFLYKEKTTYVELFQYYLDLYILRMKNSYNPTFYVPLYKLDKYNNAVIDAPKFKYLWIDKNGLHYVVFDMENEKKVFFETKTECMNQSKIIDFDDDETENVCYINISVKVPQNAQEYVLEEFKRIGIIK